MFAIETIERYDVECGWLEGNPKGDFVRYADIVEQLQRVWRPISEYRKSSTEVVVFAITKGKRTGVKIGKWVMSSNRFVMDDGSFYFAIDCEITHFMELPPLPDKARGIG
jgi:hypothetical protein